jgi:glycosyltransferase involved in cell wall biosynthesis
VVNRVAFAVPGDLATPTGGYAYDRRMIGELHQLGWQVNVVDLGEGFPHASAAQKEIARVRLFAVPGGCPIVVDGLAFGVLPEVAHALRQRNPLVALVHHPLALETGLPPEAAADFWASERAALAAARRVVATSASTARLLSADFGVAAERISIAPPGTDRAPPAQGKSDGIVRLLSVGSIVPRKGFDVLIAALAKVADLPWRLTIAGDRGRDPATSARLAADITCFKLAGRVDCRGALPAEELAVLYQRADVFVLASRFEGYGMAFAEAIAHGLPVIGTTAGAIADTVPAGAGVLVPPDDVAALAAALRRLIESPDERRWLAAQACAAAATLPVWPDSARIFAAAIEAAA